MNANIPRFVSQEAVCLVLMLEVRVYRIAGGLAWLGVLSFGVVSEQIKTRLEEKAEREGTKVLSGFKPASQHVARFMA